MDTENSGNTGTLDLDAAVEQIGDSLFPKGDDAPHEATDDGEASAPVEEAASATPAEVAPPSVARAVPKSWPSEMHSHWGTLPEPVQAYWEQREQQMVQGLGQYKTDAEFAKSLRDVMTPYKPIFASYGMNEQQAIQSLLNAQYRLTQGTPEARREAYQTLGKNLGLVQADPAAPQPDPHLQAIQQRVSQMEAALTATHQAELNQTRARISQEVDTFASDTTAHPYFNDVADDIIHMINAGHSLKDAYEKAVWANPVTRQKELGKHQAEADAKLKENARLNALKARHASSANVRSHATRSAPTEPLGSMEDTMKRTLAEMKSRT